MKPSVIVAALGLSLVLVFAMKVGHDGPSTNKAPETAGGCYADGPGPSEPTLCT
jgi:hypothetical protein